MKPQNRHIFNPREAALLRCKPWLSSGALRGLQRSLQVLQGAKLLLLLLLVVWVIWKNESLELINMYWSVYSTVPSLQVRGLRWNLKETSANQVDFREIYLIACQFMTWSFLLIQLGKQRRSSYKEVASQIAFCMAFQTWEDLSFKWLIVAKCGLIHQSTPGIYFELTGFQLFH